MTNSGGPHAPSVVARNVEFSYASSRILQSVDVTVPRNHLLGIIGPNGSGKTTLLRCLAGLLAYRGKISYGHQDVAPLSLRERAGLRAYLPQLTAQDLPYRAKDVVAFGLAHRHRFFAAPVAADEVDAALSEVGFLGDPAALYSALSGGERQQILLAQALIQGAPRIFCDEPTSALDLRHRADTFYALRKRVATGASVVVTLHDLNLASVACDSLLLLNAGRIAASGSVHDVLQADILGSVYKTPLVCGVHPQLGVPTVEIKPTWLI